MLISFTSVLLRFQSAVQSVFNAQLLDEGGGIRRSELDKLFNYMYSTAPRPPSPDAADTTPLVSVARHLAVLKSVL